MKILGAFLGAIAGAILAVVTDPSASPGAMIVGALLGALLAPGRSKTSSTPPVALRQAPSPPAQDALARPRPEAFTESFLDDALDQGLIDHPTYERLRAALMARTAVGAGARPAGVPPRPPGSIPPVPAGRERPPRPEPTRAPMPAPRVPADELPSPAPLAAWFARLREAVVSDVAVHGLAYLGVFLVFAGTLGFFLFSFGSLSLTARPWAELAVPSVLLASAWFLRRRGAPVVATALGVAGGVLLPVVLLASYVDGVAFPPDFSGDALGWAAIVTSVVLAGVYAASPRLITDSSVRYLAAPLLWTAMWSIGLLLPDAPREPLKEWTAAQFALMGIGVAATAVAVALRPQPRLARDTRASLLPGAIVSLGIGLLLAAGEDWPWWVLVVLGVTSLVSSEALADRLGATLARVLPPPLLWLAVAGLQQRLGSEVAGPALVVASFLVLEWQTARGRGGPIPIWLHAIGAGTGLVLALSVVEPQPWALVTALLPLVAWSHWRRLRPLPGVETRAQLVPIAALAAATPVALAAALVAAMRDDLAFAALAVLLWLIVALAHARPTDVSLSWWVFCAAIVLGVAAAPWSALSPAFAAVIVAASATAVIPTHVSANARAWAVVAGASPALWLALEASSLAPPARWGLVALAAAAATVGASLRRKTVASHAALAAWLATGLAVVGVASLSLEDPWLVASLAAWTLATWVAALTFERWAQGPGILAAAWFEAVGMPRLAHIVPTALSSVGPAGVALAADAAWPSIDVDVRVVIALIGLAEAAATWLPRIHGTAAKTLAMAASGMTAASAVAAVAPTEALDLSVWTLALGIATVAACAPAARFAFMPWVAWGASGALAIQLARFVGVDGRDLAVVGLGWASALALGGLAVDDLLAGRRTAGEFVRAAAWRPPTTIGLAGFPVASLLTLTGSDARIASFALMGAGVCGLIAWLLRLGSISAGSWALASVAIGVTVPWSPQEHPWLAVPWAMVLGAVGLLARPRDPATPIVRRWDLPALAVAAACLTAALVQAVVIDDVAVTWSAVGILVLAMAWVLRSPWLTTVGRTLVVVGAIDAGHGWAALVLAIVAVEVALAAARYGDEHVAMRLWHQAGAAALAAGSAWELGAWAEWSWETLAVIVLTVAGLAVAAGLLVRRRDPENPFIWQLAFLYAAMQSLGVIAASFSWPTREPMVVALLVAAGAAAVIGAFWRLLPVTLLAPVLAALAWVVSIEDLIIGTPMWWAVPSGLVLLVESAIIRDDRRARGLPVVEPTTAFLEYTGMATLLVPPVVEIFTWDPMRGLIAVAIGLVLTGWGVVTKVRRRLFAGVGGVVGTVVLMLVGPIARLVPEFEGPVLWASLAVLGLLLVLVATSLERGRARLGRALARLDEILGAWE